MYNVKCPGPCFAERAEYVFFTINCNISWGWALKIATLQVSFKQDKLEIAQDFPRME